MSISQIEYLCKAFSQSRFVHRILGRFPVVRSVRSDQSVLKWNARVLTAGSGQNGPAHGSEPLSSPAPKRGNLESCGGKNVHARRRLAPFHLNWPEPVLFGRTEQTKGKQPKRSLSHLICCRWTSSNWTTRRQISLQCPAMFRVIQVSIPAHSLLAFSVSVPV